MPKIDRPEKINRDRFPKGFKPTVVNKDPYIVNLRRLLNTDEVKTVLGMAEGKFNRSEIVVDGETITSTTRTSHTAFITDNGNYGKYSRAIDNILKKVCYLVGCERSQVESLMVVRYRPGQQYYNHHDYFEPEDMTPEDPTQRIATFFCYLNDLDDGEGGETEFPKIIKRGETLKVKPRKGTAAFWWDVDRKGVPIKKTLHRGNPPKSQTKYGLNIWIRSAPFPDPSE